MKKLWMLLLLLFGTAALAACGNGDDNGNGTPEEPHVELTRTYEGRNFLDHGIEEVTLQRCIDGDTTRFFFNHGSDSVRYKGIDTPESTMEFEPWGKAASDYVCERLENATTIVIEGEEPGATDVHGRLLGYVWVDGELLQLDLVRKGYARIGGMSKYRTVLEQAQVLAMGEGLRMWGEDDPLFETVYDIDNLAYLLDNLETYIYRPINITLEVVSYHSGRVILTDDSTTQTIELYFGNLQDSFRIRDAGNVVEFRELHLTYSPSNVLQLVNWSRHRATCVGGPCLEQEN